jgi:hypothetical protein
MSQQLYACICFNILMEGGSRSPTYVLEKMSILREGICAFAHLDRHNMRKAVAYCETWGYPVPPDWTDELKLQDEAAEKLGIM